MSKLTLPIVVGKKYVRRDGRVIEITALDGEGWADAKDDSCYWATTGCYWSPGAAIGKSQGDLVADYIEPAKGHPHAALMAEFAKDAAETETPWDRWELDWGCDKWRTMDAAPVWNPLVKYRRKPTVTPDPHAASAAEYAKDMAETDKAWERWEGKGINWNDWQPLADHPNWHTELQFRRKEQS